MTSIEIDCGVSPATDRLRVTSSTYDVAIEVFESGKDCGLIYLNVEGARELKRFLKGWIKAQRS